MREFPFYESIAGCHSHTHSHIGESYLLACYWGERSKQRKLKMSTFLLPEKKDSKTFCKTRSKKQINIQLDVFVSNIQARQTNQRAYLNCISCTVCRSAVTLCVISCWKENKEASHCQSICAHWKPCRLYIYTSTEPKPNMASMPPARVIDQI